MHTPPLFHGGLTNTTGLCPCCGTQVPRVHAWSTGRAADAYDCTSCGTFAYATDGAELPYHAQPGPASLGDLVDCVA